jgi:hypothetical protein
MQGCAAYFSRAAHPVSSPVPDYRGKKRPITHALFDVPLCQIGTELLDFASTFAWTMLKFC